jgi:hypothetical protein
MPDLGRAPSRRQIVGMAVAVVLVAGVGSWQLSRSGSRHSANATGQPAAPAGALGAVDWTAPVLQPDGSVTVYADVDATPNYCLADGVPRLTATATDSGREVRITVWAFRPVNSASSSSAASSSAASSSASCRPITRPVVPVSTAPLGRPLGSRTLTDTKTGRSHSVLTASSVPAPGFVPAGYGQPELSWDESAPDLVTRSYTGPNGQSVLIERRPLPDQPMFDEKRLASGSVLGHPARVVQSGNFADNVCAIWSDPAHVWWVCSNGEPAAALTPATLLRIGNSLH